MLKAIIKGNVPSKSSCYKIIKLGKFYSLGKTKALTDYEKSFYIQLDQKLKGAEVGLFNFEIDVYYSSMRPDLDNSFKIVLDCLQKTKTILNDNKCMSIVARKHVDKDNPRCEFIIYPI